MKIIITSDDGKVIYGEFITLRDLPANQEAVIKFRHPIAQTFSYVTFPVPRIKL